MGIALGAAPRFDAMTRHAALREAESLLRRAGLDEPRADARILIEEATGLTRFAFLGADDGPLGAEAATTLGRFLDRRLAHEPVFRIIGRREFWGLDLVVTPDVLDPRPDTETVVSTALEIVGDRRGTALRVLDLGTGSGAILCAVLSELPAARGIGVDISAAACTIARANVAACGLAARATIVEGDWGTGLTPRFDLVVSNPPYIESAALADLSPEVRDHDPHGALDGGQDGLDAYRAIMAQLPGLLVPQGHVVFEVGASQAALVAGLLRTAGFDQIATRRDLGGHERVVTGRLG